MHSRRSLVGAGLAAVTAAGLAAVLAGTGQTYASLSDFAMVTGSAAAGVWAPDPPAACFANNRKYPGGIVYGTSGPDVLGGGNQGQIIMGLAGDDIIHGNNAKDCLVGGPGDDLIQGGNGKDHLDGGSQPGDICVVEIRKDDFTGCTPVERGRGGAGARRDQATPEPEARAVTEATPGSAEIESRGVVEVAARERSADVNYAVTAAGVSITSLLAGVAVLIWVGAGGVSRAMEPSER